jgi:hypothetical protein
MATVVCNADAARVSLTHACRAACPPAASIPRATDQLYLATQATVTGLRWVAVTSLERSFTKRPIKGRDAVLLKVRIVGLLNSSRSRNAGMRLHIDSGTSTTAASRRSCWMSSPPAPRQARRGRICGRGRSMCRGPAPQISRPPQSVLSRLRRLSPRTPPLARALQLAWRSAAACGRSPCAAERSPQTDRWEPQGRVLC